MTPQSPHFLLPEQLHCCRASFNAAGGAGGPGHTRPLLAASMTLAPLPSFLLSPPDTLPIEDATVRRLITVGDPGKLNVGRQADGVGTEHIKPKPKPNVCVVAKGPTGANPRLPRGPASASLLRRGAGPLTCLATWPEAAQSLLAAKERWWRVLSPELTNPVPVFLMLPRESA